MTLAKRYRVAIVGGGFSGALTAVQLARRGVRDVVVIEPSSLFARGFAYHESQAELALNVPAHNMGALADDPGHFLAWLQKLNPAADRTSFAPRALYGRYLGELFRAETPDMEVIQTRANGLTRDGAGFVVGLEGEQPAVAADSVVLALGNAAPRPMVNLGANHGHPRVLNSPLGNLENLTPGPNDTIAIVGTGLTSLDMVAWLTRRGHRGKIISLSRRGLAPRPHQGPVPSALPKIPPSLLEQPSIRGLVEWLRGAASELEREGIDPARAADVLRPMTPTLWRRLNETDRARFLRHVRPFWDVPRHRASPETFAFYTHAKNEGRLEIQAAHVKGYGASDSTIELHVRLRAEQNITVHRVDWLLNCSGPERDLTKLQNPLVQSLFKKGLARQDTHKLGVCTTDAGELLDAQGAAIPKAFVVGPWRIANAWESVAVPELRVQAAEVAAAILRDA